jgi:hypothetical protein
VSRRTGFACIAAGVVALTAAVAIPNTAQADDEPGSGLGSFNLAANAPVAQVRYFDQDNCSGRAGGTAGCEGVVPETVSTLRNGPIGFAESSVVWPGVLAANLGSVLVAANPNVPPQAAAISYPVRAEARTGSGPDTVTNEQVPGAKMTATAKDDVVTAAAEVAQATSSPVGDFGNSSSSTSVKLTGPATAVAKAVSRASNMSFAGGQLTIGSVTSTVDATTNGVKASATGKTVVNDVRIGGVPVTIDDHGVTIDTNNAPANAVANQTVNTIVSNMGMTFAFSEPSGKPEGGKIVYNAGSLIINWAPDGGAHNFLVVLGGASVSLAAVPSGDFDFATDLGGTLATGGDTGTSAGPVLAPASGGGSAAAPVEGGALPAAPDVAAAPASGGGGTALASQGIPLPGAPSPAYLVLGLFGAGLLLAGMRQLPDRVLEAKAASCLLGETR